MRLIHFLAALLMSFTFATTADVNDIKNLVKVNENLLSGGQPTQTEITDLASDGVTSIINFRGEGEFSGFDEKTLVEQHGMQYIHFPIESRDAFSKENVAMFSKMISGNDGKTFLHCGSGNRVGALIALDAYWHQGKTASEALQIGKDAGMTSLEEHINSLMTSSDE